MKPNMLTNINPKRSEDESYEEYKERRTLGNKYLRRYLKKGNLFWPSSGLGTYIKDKHDG